MKGIQKFKKGTFKCEGCGRLTKGTDEGVALCPECLKEAWEENSRTDE